MMLSSSMVIRDEAGYILGHEIAHHTQNHSQNAQSAGCADWPGGSPCCTVLEKNTRGTTDPVWLQHRAIGTSMVSAKFTGAIRSEKRTSFGLRYMVSAGTTRSAIRMADTFMRKVWRHWPFFRQSSGWRNRIKVQGPLIADDPRLRAPMRRDKHGGQQVATITSRPTEAATVGAGRALAAPGALIEATRALRRISSQVRSIHCGKAVELNYAPAQVLPGFFTLGQGRT